MGIILPNVGIFEEKFGGDEWGFLIAEVGIFTQKILATLAVVSSCTRFWFRFDLIIFHQKKSFMLHVMGVSFGNEVV